MNIAPKDFAFSFVIYGVKGMMRCSRFRRQLARLSSREELAGDQAMSIHAAKCSDCHDLQQRHFNLLADLNITRPLPEFNDMAPRIIAAINCTPHPSIPFWQWAAAAAIVLAALVVGCLFGFQIAGVTQPQENAARTYQEAIAIAPSDSFEMAYLESNGAAGPGAATRKIP